MLWRDNFLIFDSLSRAIVFFLIFNHSLSIRTFGMRDSWLAYTVQLQTLGSMPKGGARGQHLGHI